jgi:hypothetical protein
MSHSDKEPAGVRAAKVIGAVVLVLVALVFGSVGACGAVAAVQGLWESLKPTGPEARYYATTAVMLGGFCAVVGLGVAIWAVVALLRKKEDRDE